MKTGDVKPRFESCTLNVLNEKQNKKKHIYNHMHIYIRFNTEISVQVWNRDIHSQHMIDKGISFSMQIKEKGFFKIDLCINSWKN